MVIFHSYVSLREGIPPNLFWWDITCRYPRYLWPSTMSFSSLQGHIISRPARSIDSCPKKYLYLYGKNDTCLTYNSYDWHMNEIWLTYNWHIIDYMIDLHWTCWFFSWWSPPHAPQEKDMTSTLASSASTPRPPRYQVCTGRSDPGVADRGTLKYVRNPHDIHIYIYVSIYISISITLSLYFYIIPLYLSMSLSIHASIHLSFHLSSYPSIHLSLAPSLPPSIHPSIHPSNDGEQNARLFDISMEIYVIWGNISTGKRSGKHVNFDWCIGTFTKQDSK